ncbi:MAG TPA: hypothetical protein DEB17_08450 [Chlorobaculum sp.]|uniref:Uncharacterized protein n=1 Tax=Chlorobaculum tepidum (strain ATCC 49652 / DSM 12025 / NBRC 103806 / TLS) TaxID=194439 RepID=Q8KF12_CHLTE|nr:hypothetical protein CT0520 [Chlorobaculum tepidum TLS]HBU24000.1 hypothetical protein [Chlorobaculum sp.]
MNSRGSLRGCPASGGTGGNLIGQKNFHISVA